MRRYIESLKIFFLAASSSSRSLVVGLSVRRSVCPSVGLSVDFVKKLPLE